MARWLPGKPLEVVADSAYSCREVLRHLPPGVVFVGSMCANATLQRPRSRKCRSPVTGRPLTRDIPLPKPEKIAQDEKLPWLSMTLALYGELKQVQYKELVARWYRSAGKPLLKIVIVQVERGEVPWRVFFCTDCPGGPLQRAFLAPSAPSLTLNTAPIPPIRQEESALHRGAR